MSTDLEAFLHDHTARILSKLESMETRLDEVRALVLRLATGTAPDIVVRRG